MPRGAALAAESWGSATPGEAPALTLAKAREIALANHPRVSAAILSAAAAGQIEREVRAAFEPQVYAAGTGVDTKLNSRIAAGGLNNPLIISRISYGMSMTQLVADFGRTRHLERSARMGAAAGRETVEATRRDIALAVEEAFFDALRAQAVRRVAEQTVRDRQLLVDQVSALAAAKLKSGLDVSFAKVNLADAQLALSEARNQASAALVRLAQAMGERMVDDALADEPTPAPPPAQVEPLVDEGLHQRPDLLALRASHESAVQFARAERALSRPTVSLIGAAGVTPDREPKLLRGDYSAAGINVSVPVFNGGLFSARRKEADLKARAQGQGVRELEDRVVREVREAWLAAQTAQERIGLARQLLEHASESLDLARERYTAGLGSIVELSQAELAAESARIGDAAARYEYAIQAAILEHNLGRAP